MNAATETANALAELTDAMLQAVKTDDWSLMTELDGQRLAAIDAFKHQKCNDKVDKEVMDRLRLLDEQLRSTAHAARDDVADKLVAGLVPAFQDTRNGEVHLARNGNGELALLHTFTLLPDAWVAERDDEGGAIALHPHVIAGYWQCAQFVSVDELLVKTWKNLS